MVISKTPANTRRPGSTPTNARGNATAELAIDIATRCANPYQILTAITAPKCSRTSPTASPIAARVSALLVTTKMLATDRTQFTTDQNSHATVATARKIKKASPG